MFLGGGALYLVTSSDLAAQAGKLRFLVDQTVAQRLGLHDKDRFGQKGFSRIGPGLHTAPTAEAMRAFFAAGKQGEVSQSFKLNSMQYVQRNNGCPLALVTEMPLCLDRRLSSTVKLAHSRAEEELRFAQGLDERLDEAQGWASEIRGLSSDEAGAERLARFEKRLHAARATVAAQRADLARYGDARATEGDAVETALNLRRRRAAFIAMALEALEGSTGAEGVALRAKLERALDGELEAISTEFQLTHPSLEAQVQGQLAALLAALHSPPPPKRG
jgi:hypothetical protein